MTFKVTVVNKFSENVLHKGRNGAGVKAELFFIRFDKMFGKHHVSDTKRGRDRFGKGMKKGIPLYFENEKNDPSRFCGASRRKEEYGDHHGR